MAAATQKTGPLAFALNDEMSFVDAESHRKDVYDLETHFKRIIDTYEKV